MRRRSKGSLLGPVRVYGLVRNFSDCLRPMRLSIRSVCFLVVIGLSFCHDDRIRRSLCASTSSSSVLPSFPSQNTRFGCFFISSTYCRARSYCSLVKVMVKQVFTFCVFIAIKKLQ